MFDFSLCENYKIMKYYNNKYALDIERNSVMGTPI